MSLRTGRVEQGIVGAPARLWLGLDDALGRR
jgi:hypothetical protein